MHVVQGVCFRNLLLAQGKVHITKNASSILKNGPSMFKKWASTCLQCVFSSIFGTFTKMWAKEVSGFLEAKMGPRPI